MFFCALSITASRACNCCRCSAVCLVEFCIDSPRRAVTASRRSCTVCCSCDLRLGKQFAHDLDARIEIEPSAARRQDRWRGLRGHNSIAMTTMTPIETMVPMASMRAGACANSALAAECNRPFGASTVIRSLRANERRTVKRLRPWLKGTCALTASALALTSRAMAVRDILIIPDKRLRLESEPVKAVDADIAQLVDDMFETMYDAPGIGLAAIQIGVAKRVVTMDLPKKDEPKQPQVFINPEIPGSRTRRRPTRKAACRSRNIYEEVERPAAVKVKYLDLDGKPQEIEADGLLATCLQHEIDHLNGVLFIDHISKLKRDTVIKKFTKAAKKTEAQAAAEDEEPSHHIG